MKFAHSLVPSQTAVAKFCSRIACGLLLGSLSALGQSSVWNGGGTTVNWTDGLNWVGGSSPAAGNVLFFDGLTGLTNTNNFTAATQFNGITFNSTAGNFTLAGNSITLDGDLLSNAVGNEVINLPIILGQSINATVVSGGILTLGGAISGSFGITANGTGVLNLSTANSYSGGLTINSGTVLSTNAGAWGSANVTLAGGSLLAGGNYTTGILVTGTSALTQGNVTVLTLSGPLTVNSGVTLNLLIAGGNTTTIGSNISTVTGGAGIQGNGTIELGASTGTLRFGAVSQTGSNTNHGGANITFDLGTASATVQNRNGGTTFFLGALAGGSGTFLKGAGSAAGSSVYSIGNNNQSTTFSGSIVNGNSGTTSTTVSLIKTGTGTLTLAGTGNYTGTTIINGGTLAVANLGNVGGNSSIGVSSNVTSLVINGGTLQYVGTGNTTDHLFTAGANGATLDASGTGAIVFANTSAISFNTTQTNTLNLTGCNTAANTFTPVINDNSAGNPTNVTKSGVGSWVLAGTNGYTGITTINNGVLGAAVLDIGGNSSSIGASSSAATSLVINGTLQYTGAGNTTDRLFTVGANGATLDASGSGALVFNNTGALALATPASAQTRTFTLTGTNTGTNILTPAISDLDPANTTSVVKNGVGSWTLNATNTYTGGTIVNSGTLAISSGSGSATGTGPVSLNNGATLAGSGNISGLVTANPGATLSPGNSTASVGLLTLGSLHLTPNSGGANATLNFEFSSGSVYDKINVTGSNGLTIDGGALNLYAAGTQNAWSTPGTYNLIQFSGAIQGAYASSLNSLIILNSVFGVNYTFTSSGGFLVLTIASASNPNTWNVNSSGVWSNPNNWTNNSVPTAGATVNFLSAINSPQTVVLDGSRSVGGLLFSNSAAYTIGAGSGSLSIGNATAAGNVTVSLGNHTIAAPVTLDAAGTVANITGAGTSSLTISGNINEVGSASLTKAGNGLLALTGNNTYSGGTNLNGGTVNFSAFNNLGSNHTLTFNGGALQWNATNTVDISTGTVTINAGGATLDTNGNNITLANAIGNGGTGNLTKVGNGTLALQGANTYSGGTNINGGTLSFSDLTNLGTGTSITFNSGALQWNGTNTADITNGGANTITFSSGRATLDTNGNNVTLVGPVGNGGAGGLTKAGAGYLNLLNTDSFSGNITVNNGTLGFASAASLGSGGRLTGNGGTLQWNGTNNNADISAGRTIAIGINGITFDTNGNNVTLSTAVGNTGVGDLTKIGNGNLALSVTPTYTGNTVINAGTLAFGGSYTVPSPSNVTVASGATLALLGGATFTTPTLLGSGNINLAGGTFTINTSVDQTFSGTFAGNGGLTKLGANSFFLTGVSSNNGTLSIAAGNVEIDSGASLGANGGTTSVTNGATLYINGGNFASTGTFTVGASATTTSFSGFILASGNATFNNLNTDASGANGVHPYIMIAGGNLTANNITQPRSTGTTANLTYGLVFSGGNTNVAGNIVVASADSYGTMSVQGGNVTTGTLILSNESTDSRGAQMQVSSGILNVTNATNGGFILIRPNSANLTAAQLSTVTFSGGVSNLAQLTFGINSTVTTGTATVNLTGGSVYIGSGGVVNNAAAGMTAIFNLAGGNLGASANWSTSLPLVLGGTALQTMDANANPFDITLGGVVSGSADLNQSGGGTLSLNGLNTFTGNVNVNGGTVAVAVLANGGSASGLGQSSSAATGLSITNGGLRYTGSVAGSTDRAFTLGGTGATISSTGTGNVTFSNAGAIHYAVADVANALTLAGTSTAVNTFAPDIKDNGLGATSLVKNGAGSWVATGNNTLTGPTAVNAGTLTVNTLPNSAVTVNAGGALNPVAGVGVLAVPSLDLTAAAGGANATLNFDFTGSALGSYDQILTTLTSGLTLDGGAFNLYEAGTTNAWATTGTYYLLGYSGALQGGLTPSQLLVLNPAVGLNYTFSANGSFVILNITGSLPANSWAVDANGAWSNPSNWSTGVPAASATVNFLGAAITAPRTITLDGSRTVAGLNFNSSPAYTLGPGTGTLALSGAAGPANVTVTLGNHTISAPVALDGNGTQFNITAPNSLAITGNIGESAPGAVIMAGTGTLALSGNNTYTGGTNLTAGIVNFNGTASLGLGNVTFSGGTLQWAANSSADISGLPVQFNGSSAVLDTNGNNVTLAGSFGPGSTGSLTKTGAGILTLAGVNTYSGGTNLLGGEVSFTSTANFGSGNLVFNGGGLQWGPEITTDISSVPFTFTGPGILDTNGNNVTLANPIGNNGAGGLVKTGNGVLTLGANATYTGTTTVIGGTLMESNATAIPAGSLITLGSGGTLDVSNLNATLNYVSGAGNLALGNTTLTLGSDGLSGNFTGTLGGNGTLNKIGSGTQILAGSGGYNGAINVNGGVLEIGPGANYTSFGAITAAATNGVQFYVHGGNVTTGSVFTVNLENLPGYFQDGGVANLNGGLRTNPSTSADGTILKITNGTLNVTTIGLGRTGNVTATTTPYTTGFIQTGGVVNVSGNVVVGNTNSFASASIQGGSFNVAGALILGDQVTAGRGGVMQVLGGSVTDLDPVNGLVLIQNTGNMQVANITLGGGNSTFATINFGMDATVQNGTAAVNVNGGNLFVGAGGINVRGGGTLGAAVNLISGNLGAVANWTSAAPVNFNNGVVTAADQNNNPFTITLTGTLGGTGNLTKAGAGTLVLASSAGYSGNTVISGGTLQIGNGGTQGSLGGVSGSTVTDNGVLAFNLSGFAEVDQPISGAGVFQQKGFGGLTVLGGVNTYTGQTLVTNGTLQVNPAGTLGSGNLVVSGGGNFSSDNTFANNANVTAGGTLSPGMNGLGILTLGTLNLNGNGTVSLEFDGLGGQDKLIVANSGGFAITNGGLNLYQLGGTTPFTTPGTYTDLIEYSGAIGGAGNSTLYIANAQLGLTYTIAALAGQVKVTIAANTTLTNAWKVDADGFWATGANWQNISPATGAGPSGNGITVNFPSVTTTTTRTITLNQSATAGTLNFGDALGYDIEGDGVHTLTLATNSTHTAAINVLAGNQIINAPIALNNSTIANVTAGYTLTLGGALSGSGSLTQSGNGALVLGGTNSFTGGVILQSGNLILNSNQALGTGNFTINGGNLDSIAGGIALSGFGTQLWNANFTFLGSSSLDLGAGPVTLANSPTLTVSQNTLTVDGAIAGAGQGLTKAGAGTLNLTGTSTFNGGLTILGGNVDLGATNALAAAGNVTVNGGTFNLNASNQQVNVLTLTSGSVTGTGTLSGNTFNLASGEVDAVLGGAGNLVETGGGNVTLTAVNTYTGATTLNGGTLLLTSTANNHLPVTTTLALNTGATVFLGDASGPSNQTLAGLTGGGNLRNASASTNSTVNVTIPAGTTIFTGVLGDGSGNSTTTGNHLAVVKDGPGELDLQGNNTFGGGLTINAGTLALTTNASGLMAGNGTITLNGGTLQTGNATVAQGLTLAENLTVATTGTIATIGTVNQTFSGLITGTGAVLNVTAGPIATFSANAQFANFTGTLNVNAGSLRLSSAADHNLNNTTVNLANGATLFTRDGATQTLGALNGPANSTLSGSGSVATNTTWVIGTLNTDSVFAGNITNGNVSSATALTKTGTGNLTLSGTSSYLGATTISSGTLILGSGAGISPNSTVSVAASGALDINGQSATIGGLAGAGPVNLHGGFLTTGLGGLNNTYSGTLSGSGSLTKAGTGTLTLAGNNTYAGPLNITAGKVVLTGSLIAGTDVAVQPGAAFGGSGLLSGNLLLNPGGQVVQTATSILTAQNFVWSTNGTASLFFILGAANTSSQLHLTGTLTAGSTPGGTGQFIFDFEGTGFFNSSYTLLSFPSGHSAGFSTADFAYQNLPNGMAGSFTFDPSGALTFNISPVPEPAQAAATIGLLALLAVAAYRRRQKTKNNQLS